MKLNWFENPEFLDKEVLFPEAMIKDKSDHAVLPLLMQWLSVCNFGTECSKDWATIVFENLVLPVLKSCLERGLLNEALYIENYLYGAWLKREESEHHYDESFARWAPEMRRAGKLFAEKFPKLKQFEKAEAPTIAFFIHAASTLAHVQILFMALEAVHTQNRKDFIPKIYVLSGFHEEMKQWFDSINVEVCFIEQVQSATRLSIIDRLVWLRRHLEKERIDFLVWTCLPIFLSFVAGFKLAHRQVWFSMKFHPRAIDELDGYITLHHGFSKKVELVRREWRTVPEASKNLFNPSLKNQADAIRAKLCDFDMILGTLAREETVATPHFLEILTKILKKNRKAVWLYTGRKNHSLIVDRMRLEGLTDQTRFIGWVDTRLFAQVLDIYVDCWPLGSGLTGFQAMAAGVPYVFYCGPTSMEHEWILMKTLLVDPLRSQTDRPAEVARLKEIFDLHGDMLLMAADSPMIYLSFVQKLIDDASFRVRVGNAYRVYADTFLADTSRLGVMLTEHILDIHRSF